MGHAWKLSGDEPSLSCRIPLWLPRHSPGSRALLACPLRQVTARWAGAVVATPRTAGCRRRLSASHAAAEKYIEQFPNPLLSHVARLVAFVAGSFAALALGAAAAEDFLLERRLAGRTLVWCPPPPPPPPPRTAPPPPAFLRGHSRRLRR